LYIRPNSQFEIGRKGKLLDKAKGEELVKENVSGCGQAAGDKEENSQLVLDPVDRKYGV
jgi:hypothetical protein